ncbi:MAG: hypothetical protein CFE24_12850 [Flavobacterium sp. BFFFF2]|nr:MAG: hypothetical protein CFE24_12850 [Flavobacterium sp. BFFFF2]
MSIFTNPFFANAIVGKSRNLLKICLFGSVLFVFSCVKKEDEPAKVIYTPKTPAVNSEKKSISKKSQWADLPVQFDGCSYLMFPIGDITKNESGHDVSPSITETNFTMSNATHNELTGAFSNLAFQHKDSMSYHLLSAKPLYIQTVSLIETLVQKKKMTGLIYTLSDVDTNQDGTLSATDIHNLYWSSTSGKNFQKLTPELEELIDWKWMASTGYLYFRTVKDTNKNGTFDPEDQAHYYRVNMLLGDVHAEEFNPIGN